jgi:hypothetical protein
VSNGGVNTVVFTFQNADGSLYPITGLTWEFVVRRDASDAVTPSVISVTQTPNSQGLVTANTGASTVTVTLYPAATLALPARTVYAHTLWADPGGTTTATAWVWGGFIINQVAQP